MALAETLKRVDEEIAGGDLGKARDRLLGLLRTYPSNLYVRDRLGDVYWKLQYPELAGRYWYLFERETPEMERACVAFERKFAGHPLAMLREIGYRGGLSPLAGSYAEQCLLALAREARVHDSGFFEPKARRHHRGERERVIGGVAFSIIAACLLVFSLVGIVSTVQWIIALVR